MFQCFKGGIIRQNQIGCKITTFFANKQILSAVLLAYLHFLLYLCTRFRYWHFVRQFETKEFLKLFKLVYKIYD